MKNFITIFFIIIILILGGGPLSIITFGGTFIIYFILYKKFNLYRYNTYKSSAGRKIASIRICLWFYLASSLYYLLKRNRFRVQVFFIILPIISLFFGYHIDEICHLYMMELFATFFSNILVLLILKKIHIKSFFSLPKLFSFFKAHEQKSQEQATLFYTSILYFIFIFFTIVTKSLTVYSLITFGIVFILQLITGLKSKTKENYTILPFSRTPFSNMLFIKLVFLIGMWVLTSMVVMINDENVFRVNGIFFNILAYIILFIMMLKGEVIEILLEDGLLKKENREKWFQDFNKFYKL